VGHSRLKTKFSPEELAAWSFHLQTWGRLGKKWHRGKGTLMCILAMLSFELPTRQPSRTIKQLLGYLNWDQGRG
jgi:hypothetical protein